MNSSTTQPRKSKKSLRNSVPVAYARLLLEFAQERGVGADQVLDGSQLSAEVLEQPDARMTAAQASALTINVMQLTNCQGIGFEIGLRAKPTVHGFLGYAALSSPTAGDAFNTFGRYLRLRSSDFVFVQGIEGDNAWIDIEETHSLGSLRRTLYEGTMGGFHTLLTAMLGARPDGVTFHFEWPEPPYFEQYRARLPQTLFGQPSNRVLFPAYYLGQRLPMGDPVAAKSLVAECERQLALLGPPVNRALARVRAELTAGHKAYPGLEAIAQKLHMSGRTLKRKLAEAGTSYQKILDEQRHRDSLRLLSNPDLEVGHIASILGYTDPAHFTRAFRRWSGQTPSQARESLNTAVTLSAVHEVE
jgi:AraC-like DNA-binding protein